MPAIIHPPGGGVSGPGDASTTLPLSQFAPTTSAQLRGVMTDETGGGALVFGTSPSFTTSIIAASATMALFNTTATTVNAFGAATTVTMGGSANLVLNLAGSSNAAQLRFISPVDGTSYTGFKAGAALAENILYSLPETAPTAGQVLTAGASPLELEWGAGGSGSGDVTGPVSSADLELVAFDGVGGDTIRGTGAFTDGSGTLIANTLKLGTDPSARAVFDPTSITGFDKTFLLPDYSGTLALLSDLTAVPIITSAPADSDAAGVAGMIAYDTDYFYYYDPAISKWRRCLGEIF